MTQRARCVHGGRFHTRACARLKCDSLWPDQHKQPSLRRTLDALGQLWIPASMQTAATSDGRKILTLPAKAAISLCLSVCLCVSLSLCLFLCLCLLRLSGTEWRVLPHDSYLYESLLRVTSIIHPILRVVTRLSMEEVNRGGASHIPWISSLC